RIELGLAPQDPLPELGRGEPGVVERTLERFGGRDHHPTSFRSGCTNDPPWVYERRARRQPPRARVSAFTCRDDAQAVNELPQPQPPVAFGLLNVKPEPIIVVT